WVVWLGRSDELFACRCSSHVCSWQFGGSDPNEGRLAFAPWLRLTSRRQLDLAGRLVDRLDADFDRIAEPESPAAPTADQRGGKVIELEVVASEAAGREEALEDLAETGEEARADDADDLAFERLIPASFVELGIEQPGQADVVRAVFHIGCSPLPLGRVVCELAQVRRHGVLGNV